MSGADVPEDGEIQIGSVRLPAGRRIRSNDGRGEPVAWATADPVPGAGRVWTALGWWAVAPMFDRERLITGTQS